MRKDRNSYSLKEENRLISKLLSNSKLNMSDLDLLLLMESDGFVSSSNMTDDEWNEIE